MLARAATAGPTNAETEFVPAALTPTLPLQIADQIGAAVVEERFVPGERLKEVELASAFGVSRATVREALRILESRRLVRILPQRGAQVTLLSRSELENLFEIRAALLGLAGRNAAKHFQKSDRSELQRHVTALASARGSAKAYVKASAEMVRYVARLSRNEALAEMMAGFAQQIGRYTRLGLASEARRAQSLASWRRLAQAVSANDQDGAEEINRNLALENRAAALVEIERRAPVRSAVRKRNPDSR